MGYLTKTSWATVYKQLRDRAFSFNQAAFLAGDDHGFNSSLDKALAQAGLQTLIFHDLKSLERKFKTLKPSLTLLIIDGDRLNAEAIGVVSGLKERLAQLNVILIAAGRKAPAALWPEGLIEACLNRSMKPEQLGAVIKALRPCQNMTIPGMSRRAGRNFQLKPASARPEGRPKTFHRGLHKLLAKTSELNQIKMYLENILDSSLDAIMILNDQGQVIYMNRGASIMLGYQLNLTPGLTLRNLMAKDGGRPKNTLAKLKKAVSRTGYLETWLVKADGSKLYGLLSFNQLFLSSQKGKSEYLLVIKDIDYRRQLEEKLIKQNLQLEKMSITDVLTQLHNRRYLDRKLYNEFQRVKRFGGSLAVIFIDFDDFKLVNDQFGHKTGDKVLYQAAAEIGYALREVDTFARWGGEEFLVVLPQTDLAKARVAAERLREAIDNPSKWAAIHPDLTVTISLGVSAYPHKGVNSLNDLIEAADQAVYQAKRNGKNQVVAMNELTDEVTGHFVETARLVPFGDQSPAGPDSGDGDLGRKLKNVLKYLYNISNLEPDSFGAFMVWGHPSGFKDYEAGEGCFTRALSANFQHNHSSLRIYPLLVTLAEKREPELCGILALAQQPENETSLLDCLERLTECLTSYYQGRAGKPEQGAPLVVVAEGDVWEAPEKNPLNLFKRDLRAWLKSGGFKRSVMLDLDRSAENGGLNHRLLNLEASGREAIGEFRRLTGRGHQRLVWPTLRNIWGSFSDLQRGLLIQAGFRQNDGPLVVRPLWLDGARKGLLIITDSPDNLKESHDRLNFYIYQIGCYHNYELTNNWLSGPGQIAVANSVSASIAGQPRPLSRESFFQCLFQALAQLMPGFQVAVYSLNQETRSAHRFSCWPDGGWPVSLQAKNDPVVAHLLREGLAGKARLTPPRPSNQSLLNLPLGRPGEPIGFARMSFQNGQRITAHELDLALLLKEMLSSFIAIFNYSNPLSVSISPSAFQIVSAIMKYWLI